MIEKGGDAMIKALIENYKELTVVGVFAIMMAWYLWHQTRRQSKREDKHDAIQKEERIFYRNLVTNDMKELHQDSLKNTELNIKGIALQREMIKDFKSHNGHSKEFSKKMVETLDLICDKIDRRRSDKRVKVERRA